MTSLCDTQGLTDKYLVVAAVASDKQKEPHVQRNHKFSETANAQHCTVPNSQYDIYWYLWGSTKSAFSVAFGGI